VKRESGSDIQQASMQCIENHASLRLNRAQNSNNVPRILRPNDSSGSKLSGTISFIILSSSAALLALGRIEYMLSA